MRTLREIGVFVGIPEDSPEFGAPSNIGLRLAGDLLAPTSPAAQNRSLLGINDLIGMLSPISLDAALLDSDGVEPFQPVIRIAPSQGLVISTHVLFIISGQLLYYSPNYGAAGGDVTPTQLGPGQWDIVVRRSGIGSGGYQRLEKSFGATVARDQNPPLPPRPPLPPPQPQPPKMLSLSIVNQATAFFSIVGVQWSIERQELSGAFTLVASPTGANVSVTPPTNGQYHIYAEVTVADLVNGGEIIAEFRGNTVVHGLSTLVVVWSGPSLSHTFRLTAEAVPINAGGTTYTLYKPVVVT